MRNTALITTVALAAALAVPAAAAAQDLRSPDARDAALASRQADTQDLRSPDARDAGREIKPAPVSQPVVEITEAPGFNWGDAGIGAAAILALCSLAGGLALLEGGRRRRRVGMPAN